MALCFEDTQKLLEDITSTWATMEEIDDLIAVFIKLQKNQQELDVVATTMKDLPPLQRMMKMGENKRLQTKLQKLRAQEEEYLKIVQPWQEEVSVTALQVNAKLTKFKAT